MKPPRTATPSPGPPRAAPTWVSLALVALTCAVYFGVAGLGFVEFDDPQYVSRNPRVLQGFTLDSLRYAFTTTDLGNWHPLTWLSHVAVAQLYGADPAAHHVFNLLLHAANVVLFFRFLAGTTAKPWPSAFAAALFAVHPLHVESVAWVAERKDVLSTLFWLLALLAWARWTRERRASLYLATLCCFVLGLMSKPMLVTLPLTLLWVDLWPLGRWRPFDTGSGERLASLVREKLPLFALAAASAVVTLAAQRGQGAMEFGETIAFGTRAANALRSIGVYLAQTVWPLDLAVFYPYPKQLPALEVLGGALALAALGAASFLARRRAPFVAAGAAWFVITLVPVLGLVQVGDQAHADRYTYVPHLGLFAAAAFALERLAAFSRGLALGLAGAALLACSLLTPRQVETWRDDRELFAQAVGATRGNSLAHDHLAQAYLARGRSKEAAEQYREIVRLEPERASAHVNLGTALEQLGEIDQARACYQRAIELDPNAALAHSNLGVLLAKSKRFEEAAPLLARAVELEPEKGGLRANLALNEFLRGERASSLEHFRAALELDPATLDQPLALQLAWMLATDRDPALRDGALALRIAEHAVRSRPAPDAGRLEILAAAQAESGRFDDAERVAQGALELARAQGLADLGARLGAALALYSARAPYRAAPPR